MNQADEASREIAALRREVAELRAELNALKQLLGASQGEVLRERQNPLALRCASLEVLGQNGAPLAVLMATPEGSNFALCAPDGKPRVVLQSRDEGGGVSFVDGNGDLGAEVWGASEAAWFSLLHDGRLAVVAVAATQGGNVEVFDKNDVLLAALPANAVPLHSPE
jgi:hypothetical protein